MRASRNEYVGVLAAIASSALGGVAGGTTRFAIGSSDPLTLGVFRFGVGFLLLLPIALALRIKWPRGRDWLGVAALGVMYFAFFIVLFNLAFRYTTAARGSLALSTLPLMTMRVGAALGVEALDVRKSVGVIIAMAGAAVALVAGLAHTWRGDLIMAAATLVMALYNVWSRPSSFARAPWRMSPPAWDLAPRASWPWPPGATAMRALQAFMVRNGWRWFIWACSPEFGSPRAPRQPRSVIILRPSGRPADRKPARLAIPTKRQRRRGGDDEGSHGCYGERRAHVRAGDRARDRLSEQTNHADDRLRARRAERRDGAHPHQEDGGDPQTANGHREPRRRRRQHRRRRGRARRPRRLHAAARHRQPARDQRESLQKHRLRSRKGLRADRSDRNADQRPLPQSVGAGDLARRVDRLRQSQSGQAQLRLGRQRHAGASRRRVAQTRSQDRHHACAVPRHRAGAASGHRRTRPDGVQSALAVAPSHPERHHSPTRGHDAQANAGIARGPHHRRVGLSRLRGDDLACTRGAGGEAEGRHRHAASRDRCDRQRSAGAQSFN